MTLSDRVFIAMLATLALFVLVVEKCNRAVPLHVLPPPAGTTNLQLTNVPNYRQGSTLIEDVAYIDMGDAALAGNE